MRKVIGYAAIAALDTVCTLAVVPYYGNTLPLHEEWVDGNRAYPNLEAWAQERIRLGKALSEAIRRTIWGWGT